MTLAGATGADIICCGHSHAYFARPIRRKWFINPGSVGRPFDGDPRASYAIVALRGGAISVRNIRIPYDIDKLSIRAAREHFDGVLLAAFAAARSLDDCRVDIALSGGAIVAFAKKYHHEASHAEQVTRCALQLFDALMPQHGLGLRERAYLNAAAILHDIGFSSPGAHHKKTFVLIRRQGKSLGLPARERNLIGLIARYHRKALPHPSHPGYAHLCGKDRTVVSMLAAILRVADGLDNSHAQSSRIKCCLTSGSQVTIVLKNGARFCDKEAAAKKSDLFRRVFRKKLIIR
ncbi:MAG: metallophosphoesterase family protein [Candidatus Omnitrophica bacterium]|nr:metallophosphoesterase family protein [Candidatus Omnitrophota bacterium]